ncbi:Fur family transcriptional regulator [Streptomyces sp. F-1]|uniref:Fur family transcriptional regulator n=1 Tax=Streptomyces sp. F-1 TaxID=463642 RepID=UPI00086F733E|nr:Fur family transcriptional regulator [Streptomyces sp. F-1]SFY47415.1 Transcriptional regulator FurA [Streptomyces sp. F-1]
MAREAVAEGRETAIRQLRDAGLRVTSPRLEVLHVLAAGEHLDVEGLTAAARERLGTLTSQAVYEMLRHFLEAGLVTKFERPGWPAVFEIAGTRHQHALCVQCGRVENVAHQAPVLPRKDLPDWELDDADIVFKGLCPDCRSASRAGR